MALIPSNTSSTLLVQCEWRLFLSPECPYYEATTVAYEVALALYCISLVFLIGYSVFRRTTLGQRLVNKSFEGGFFLALNPNLLVHDLCIVMSIGKEFSFSFSFLFSLPTTLSLGVLIGITMGFGRV